MNNDDYHNRLDSTTLVARRSRRCHDVATPSRRSRAVATKSRSREVSKSRRSFAMKSRQSRKKSHTVFLRRAWQAARLERRRTPSYKFTSTKYLVNLQVVEVSFATGSAGGGARGQCRCNRSCRHEQSSSAQARHLVRNEIGAFRRELTCIPACPSNRQSSACTVQQRRARGQERGGRAFCRVCRGVLMRRLAAEREPQND